MGKRVKKMRKNAFKKWNWNWNEFATTFWLSASCRGKSINLWHIFTARVAWYVVAVAVAVAGDNRCASSSHKHETWTSSTPFQRAPQRKSYKPNFGLDSGRGNFWQLAAQGQDGIKKHIKCLSTRSLGGNHSRYILSSQQQQQQQPQQQQQQQLMLLAGSLTTATMFFLFFFFIAGIWNIHNYIHICMYILGYIHKYIQVCRAFKHELLAALLLLLLQLQF